MGIWIIFIIALIVSIIIVNGAQRLFMKVLGADVMFFRAKPKIIAIIVLALLLASLVINALGIQIPHL